MRHRGLRLAKRDIDQTRVLDDGEKYLGYGDAQTLQRRDGLAHPLLDLRVEAWSWQQCYLSWPFSSSTASHVCSGMTTVGPPTAR